MKQRNEIWKCEDCGLVLEVLSPCQENCPVLECCGKPFVRMTEQTADAASEKHVPVPAGDHLVRVGSVPHPMTDSHRIMWIEVQNGDYVNRKYLKPGEKPEAEFFVTLKSGMILREYCNIHGLWSAVIP